MTAYREIIRQLTADEPGLCIDATCPKCDHYEMSLRVKWPECIPLDPPVIMCRKCGHAQRTRPRSQAVRRRAPMTAERDAAEAEALQAIKNVPRRIGTAEWSGHAEAIQQGAGFDVGLAAASHAVASAFASARRGEQR